MRVDQFRTAFDRLTKGRESTDGPPVLNVYLTSGRMLAGTPFPPDLQNGLLTVMHVEHGEAVIDIEGIDALQAA
jgi:hypothetical protein